MLIECVMGAMGLAIEHAALNSPSDDRLGELQAKTAHLKQVVRRRVVALVKRRRRIETLKSRLQFMDSSACLERLHAGLTQREKIYQERLSALQRGRRKLARLEQELRTLRGEWIHGRGRTSQS